MVRKIGIDTNILIYAFARPTSEEGKTLSKRAGWLLDHLFNSVGDEKSQLVISIISVAEYLVKVAFKDHSAAVRMLETKFEIAPFNLKAASFAADLANKAKNNPAVVRRDGDRHFLMADTKIVGALLAAGICEFYANDDRISSVVGLAGGKVKARPLPKQPMDLLQLQDETGNPRTEEE